MHAAHRPAPRAAIVTALVFASSAARPADDAAASAVAPSSAGSELEEIFVVAARESRSSRGAVILPLQLVDTPQSVSVVDREFIESFGLDDANRLLHTVTGVNVEEVETDRTYYNSRGFDIKSMQVDGIGLPFNWNVVGALDTAVYDKVEVIRGANGLLTGTGNPSGTINYVRKRPTNVFQAAADASAGSWNRQRLVADLSGPLTASGTWAGRVVAAAQSADSYLDLNETERTIAYGVVEGQVGERSALTVGYTQQDNASKGALWGALPLLYADGTQTDFDAATTTAMRWTRWDTHSKTAFAELAHALSDDWNMVSTVTWNDYEEPSELFYVSADPGLDRVSGQGLYGWPGAFLATVQRTLFDATLTGAVDAGGRRHDVIVGLSLSRADNGYEERTVPGDDPAWGALPSFPGWSGREVARPAFGERVEVGDWSTDVNRLFGVVRVNASDRLKVLAGFNAIDVTSDGYNFDEPQDSDDRKLSPYVGLTWSIADALNAYASYSDIYEPQPEVGPDLRPLGPAEGVSYEVGLKGEFVDQRLLASMAAFRAEQDNYAEYAGFDVDSGISYYRGVDVDAEGVELEASGWLTDRWSLLAGYTWLELTGSDGKDARTFVPRQTFNLATRYRPQRLAGVELGATVKWRDDIHLDTGTGVIRQPAYALGSAYVDYAFSGHFEVGLRVDNVTDEKYLTSLYWDQAFYGAPRSTSVTFRYRY